MITENNLKNTISLRYEISSEFIYPLTVRCKIVLGTISHKFLISCTFQALH
jgi:hypothetical protein